MAEREKSFLPNKIGIVCGTAVILVAAMFFAQTKVNDSPTSRDGYVFLSKKDFPVGTKMTESDMKLQVVPESKIPQMAIWNPAMATTNPVEFPISKGKILEARDFGLDPKELSDLGTSKWKGLTQSEISKILRAQKNQ
ncbi:MAG TPA: hypothetical protein EYN91_25685 [Candidatus Melainabacteria bacterium]|nr:hypothetical protein [Candidatus Melainabacteria bacterium]